MKKRIAFIAWMVLATGMISLYAQHVQKRPKEKVVAAEKKPARDITVVLGQSELQGGVIPKAVFDSLAKQGLRTLDTAGVVTGFEFNYKERVIYEDSIGNLIRVVDLLSEYCIGNELSEAISSSIYFRTKKGDTAFFDNIKVRWSDGSAGRGKSMKFVIQ